LRDVTDTGPPASPEAEADTPGPAGITAISDRLDQLGQLFETKILEAERQQRWAAQLTSELAEYRSDFVFTNILSRVFRDLIQLHDALSQALDPAALDGMTREELLARLRHLQKQLLRTFDRQGLEQISSDALTRFNEAEQEAIDVQPVDHPEKDGIVVESTRCGFRYGPRLLRPESVIIGRYEPRNEEADD
jgi:molecular chaperone GrpE